MTRCIERVHEGGRGVCFYQCQNKRGKGKDGLYCGQHAALIAKREADAKKCWNCHDLGYVFISVPKKIRCTECKQKK